MPDHIRVNVNQVENRQFEVQYGHHPSYVAPYPYVRVSTTYYYSSTIQTSVHYQQLYHCYPPQYQQLHTANLNASGYAAGIQNIQATLNMPWAYNDNFHIPPNHHLTTRHNKNTTNLIVDSNWPILLVVPAVKDPAEDLI